MQTSKKIFMAVAFLVLICLDMYWWFDLSPLAEKTYTKWVLILNIAILLIWLIWPDKKK